MPRRVATPFPSHARQLTALGDRLRLARKRRKFSAVLVAERAGISRDTFSRVEKGDPSVSLGTYLKVLRILGLDSDIDLIAQDDKLGRKLQDLQLEVSTDERKKRPSRADV
jgi:transcriptional regulator with XRE-family HTH domain